MSSNEKTIEPLVFMPVLRGERLRDLSETYGKKLNRFPQVSLFAPHDENLPTNLSQTNQPALINIFSLPGLEVTFGLKHSEKISREMEKLTNQEKILGKINMKAAVDLRLVSASTTTDTERSVSYVAIGFDKTGQADIYERRRHGREAISESADVQKVNSIDMDPLPALPFAEVRALNNSPAAIQYSVQVASLIAGALDNQFRESPADILAGPARFS